MQLKCIDVVIVVQLNGQVAGAHELAQAPTDSHMHMHMWWLAIRREQRTWSRMRSIKSGPAAELACKSIRHRANCTVYGGEAANTKYCTLLHQHERVCAMRSSL